MSAHLRHAYPWPRFQAHSCFALSYPPGALSVASHFSLCRRHCLPTIKAHARAHASVLPLPHSPARHPSPSSVRSSHASRCPRRLPTLMFAPLFLPAQFPSSSCSCPAALSFADLQGVCVLLQHLPPPGIHCCSLLLCLLRCFPPPSLGGIRPPHPALYMSAVSRFPVLLFYRWSSVRHFGRSSPFVVPHPSPPPWRLPCPLPVLSSPACLRPAVRPCSRRPFFVHFFFASSSFSPSHPRREAGRARFFSTFLRFICSASGFLLCWVGLFTPILVLVFRLAGAFCHFGFSWRLACRTSLWGCSFLAFPSAPSPDIHLLVLFPALGRWRRFCSSYSPHRDFGLVFRLAMPLAGFPPFSSGSFFKFSLLLTPRPLLSLISARLLRGISPRLYCTVSRFRAGVAPAWYCLAAYYAGLLVGAPYLCRTRFPACCFVAWFPGSVSFICCFPLAICCLTFGFGSAPQPLSFCWLFLAPCDCGAAPPAFIFLLRPFL